MVNIFTKVKDFIINRLLGKITREIKYRNRLKELRKRDPFIYK